LGKVSLKQTSTKATSVNAKQRAKSAGTTNQSPDCPCDQWANMAPMTGPTMNPKENAIPTSA
jgi:hypothetical protein